MKKAMQGHPAHVELATVAIGAMAMGLAAGLELMGLADRLDAALGYVLLPKGMKPPTRDLDPLVLWLSTAFLSIAIPAVILNIAATWRRMLIWMVTFALTLLWGPVLLLSAHEPGIAIPLAAVLWSGFCAVFYAGTHKLPVEGSDETHIRRNDGQS